MKKTNRSKLVAAALFVVGWATACGVSTKPESTSVNQPAAQTAANSSSPATNANAADANATHAGAAGDKASAGSLATPTEAYKTAYAARQKKDAAGLKRTLSKDILDFFETMAEAENKKLEDELQQLADKPQGTTDETRNEKIDGDTATLEYVDEKGKWKTMDFVKEGGDWKLTIPKPKPGEVEVTTGKPD
jgi:predicted lipid-binding transport protein (Tim44 family)